MAEELEHLATQQGEEVVTSTLASRAVELTQLLETAFPRKTLAEVEAAYMPSGVAPNASLTQLTRLVREQAAVATEHFKQAELWLVLKSPAVSDGNNFGVDVQQYVAGELKELRKAFAGMIGAPADWHWARATGLEKVAQVRRVMAGCGGRRKGQRKRGELREMPGARRESSLRKRGERPPCQPLCHPTPVPIRGRLPLPCPTPPTPSPFPPRLFCMIPFLPAGRNPRPHHPSFVLCTRVFFSRSRTQFTTPTSPPRPRRPRRPRTAARPRRRPP